MLSTGKRLAAVIAASGVLAIIAPAGASAVITGFPVTSGVAPLGLSPPGTAVGVGPCSRTTSELQGGTASAEPQVCQGAGLTFIGPAVGQVASVIGPTIIGPTAVGSVVVSAGDAGVSVP